MKLYQEAPDAGNVYRQHFASQFQTWLDAQFEQAEKTRTAYFTPDMTSPEAYAISIARFRDDYINMLGFPLNQYTGEGAPAARCEHVADDDLGQITRLWIEIFPGVELYGILFMPKGDGPFPLAISQHGGGGTPELCSHLIGESNYNDMTRRVLRRGIAVFAPQLFRWDGERFGPRPDNNEIHDHLTKLGGSIAAFEITCLRRALDYLQTLPLVDAERMGMIGLSYGGFFTLYTAAAETRLKVAVSSCFFNDRRTYGWRDWTWPNAANRFFDAEVAALVCPRALYIEVGVEDELFDVNLARVEYQRLKPFYAGVGLADQLVFKAHPGKHELDPVDDGIDFLEKHLKA